MTTSANDLRLWGWLKPDAPDLLKNHPAMAAFLAERMGLAKLGERPPLPLREEQVEPSRLSPETLVILKNLLGSQSVDISALGRAKSSLGQSYVDHLRRRSGVPGPVVDCVVHAKDRHQLQPLVELARDHGFRLIPVGGATNVVGAFDGIQGEKPLVALSMSQLDRVLSVNEIDRTVTVEAGISLAAIEKELALRNFTLGHFPQSFHGATVGGSLMANGAGQVSDLYGRMSDMLVSARLVTPQGMWATEPFRHAGAGPWLGSLVAGSEGLFGILADVTLKIRPQPQMIEDRAWYLPSFGAGCEVLRHLAQDGHGMAMLRLSDPAETEFYGRVRLMSKGLQRPGFLERAFLAIKNAPQNPALLMGAFEGLSASRKEAFRQVDAAVKKHGGVSLGTAPGKSWRKSRFDTPHLRESILAHDLAVDTFETATTWSGMEALHQDLLSSLERAGSDILGGNRCAIAFSHVSHTYAEGASLYATMIFQRGDDPLAEWQAVKAAAAKAIHRAGATISHHHGLGFMHATDALNEKSEIGQRLLSAVRNELDPQNILASGAENWIG